MQTASARRIALLAAALTVAASGAVAGSRDDDCRFYRMQARGQGMEHYATEALWACEAVVTRRAAGMPMSDRMLALEFALDAYRDAFDAEQAARYPRTSGPGVSVREARDRARALLAEETGMLAALEAVRSGF